jgi:hypothetical protein
LSNRRTIALEAHRAVGFSFFFSSLFFFGLVVFLLVELDRFLFEIVFALCNGREKEREKSLEPSSERERKRGEKSVGLVTVINLGPT